MCWELLGVCWEPLGACCEPLGACWDVPQRIEASTHVQSDDSIEDLDQMGPFW